MPDRLPPLTALRAFDAAARHMSFSAAAKELFVTPAALSYQIKQLEEHLGQPVFHRLNRAIELTEAGEALRPGVAEAFENIRQAARAVARISADPVLTITAGPAFTAKWLAPRFFRFADAHKDMELRFVASLRTMDFHRDGVDAAIRFAKDIEETLYSEVLADEWLTPVCTPALAERVIEQQSFDGLSLIHDESIQFIEPYPGWEAWSRVSGMELDWTHGPRFSNADHAIDVALEGAGVALGRIVLVERYLDTGRLVAPFKLGMRAGGAFHFVCPLGDETKPMVCTFLEWLRAEISDIDRHEEGMTLVDL